MIKLYSNVLDSLVVLVSIRVTRHGDPSSPVRLLALLLAEYLYPPPARGAGRIVSHGTQGRDTPGCQTPLVDLANSSSC